MCEGGWEIINSLVEMCTKSKACTRREVIQCLVEITTCDQSLKCWWEVVHSQINTATIPTSISVKLQMEESLR